MAGPGRTHGTGTGRGGGQARLLGRSPGYRRYSPGYGSPDRRAAGYASS